MFYAVDGTHDKQGWLCHAFATYIAADEGESNHDSEFLKEFVVSPDDLVAEAILDQQSAREQQQVCLAVASKQKHPHIHCDGNSRCSISTSSESKPPLSPSVDGSQASLTPDSSMTFAGKASRGYKMGSEQFAKHLHCAGMRSMVKTVRLADASCRSFMC